MDDDDVDINLILKAALEPCSYPADLFPSKKWCVHARARPPPTRSHLQPVL